LRHPCNLFERPAGLVVGAGPDPLTRPETDPPRRRQAGVQGCTGRAGTTTTTEGFRPMPALLVSRRTRPARPASPFRPGLEALESRYLLSPLTVTDPGDSGPRTLRGLIAAASPGDTVNFAPGLTRVTLTSGSLALTRNVTIQGPADGSTVTV